METITDRDALLTVIDAEEVQLGRNVRFGEGVRIAAVDGRARRVSIGDNVFLGPGVLIQLPEFEIGDYGTIHRNCRLSGQQPLRIGHNFWCDQNCILNCTAPLKIGHNVGIGAYSQLWTHIKYGDTLFGCRFEAAKAMTVHNDVWLVGHCLVSPIEARPRSMAMLGSTIVSNMEENRIYAGSPAKDITDKLGGPPFVDVSVEERLRELERRVARFFDAHPDLPRDAVRAVTAWDGELEDDVIYFNVADRTYTKRGSPVEIKLMSHLLPTAKFCPR